MDIAQIKKDSMAFKRSRGNLLLVVVFTAVNLFMIALNSGFHFPFSATIPTVTYDVISELGYGAVGLIAALAMVSVYLACYLLSKKRRVFILIALIFFAVDTLLFLFISFGYWDDIGSLLIEAVFTAWILFYLITGTAAWARLRKVSAEDIEAAKEALANDEVETTQKKTLEALDEITPNSDNDNI